MVVQRVALLLGVVIVSAIATTTFPPLLSVDEEGLAEWEQVVEDTAEEAVRSINQLRQQQREQLSQHGGSDDQ